MEDRVKDGGRAPPAITRLGWFYYQKYQKNAEFYADFKSVDIIWKKCT